MGQVLRLLGQGLGAASDLEAASAYLEEAIHASSESDMWTELGSVDPWLRWAQQDLQDAGSMATANLIDKMATWLEGELAASSLPDGMSLAAYQSQVLVPFQGGIAAAIAGPVAERGREEGQSEHDYNMALVGVLGFALLAVGVGVGIDFKQRHGGYSRGPRAKSYVVTGYRYPER